MGNQNERLIPPVVDLARRGPLAVIDVALCWAVVSGLIALTASLMIQVIARYVVGNPTIWSEELAISLFVWVSMLAIPLGFRRGEHLAIDLLSRRLRPTAVKALASVISLLSAMTLGVIGYYAFSLVGTANRQSLPGITEGLGIPAKVSWVYLAVPIGCAIAILFILERLWAVWRGHVLVLNEDADSQAVEHLDQELDAAGVPHPLAADGSGIIRHSDDASTHPREEA